MALVNESTHQYLVLNDSKKKKNKKQKREDNAIKIKNKIKKS